VVYDHERKQKMNFAFLLALLTASGFVTLAIAVSFRLLKSSQVRENADDDRVWELLLRPEKRYVDVAQLLGDRRNLRRL